MIDLDKIKQVAEIVREKRRAYMKCLREYGSFGSYTTVARDNLTEAREDLWESLDEEVALELVAEIERLRSDKWMKKETKEK